MSRITIKKLKSYIYLFGVLDLVQQTGTTYNPMVKIRTPYNIYPQGFGPRRIFT